MNPRGPCSDPYPKEHNGTLRSDGKYWCFRHARGRRHHGKSPPTRYSKNKGREKLTDRDILAEGLTRRESCLIVSDPRHTCWSDGGRRAVRFCHIDHKGMGGAYAPSYRNGWPGCDRAHMESHRSVIDFDRRYFKSANGRQAEANRIGDIVDAKLGEPCDG